MKISTVWGLFTQELIYSTTYLPFRQHCRAVLLPHPNPPPSPRCLLAVPAPSCTFMTCSQHSLSNLQGKSAQPHVAHGEQFLTPLLPAARSTQLLTLAHSWHVGFVSKLRASRIGPFFFSHFFFLITNKQPNNREMSAVLCRDTQKAQALTRRLHAFPTAAPVTALAVHHEVLTQLRNDLTTVSESNTQLPLRC